MERSQVKTIAIITLALINLFFLSLIIIDFALETRDTRLEIELAAAVLASEGISINSDEISINRNISAMVTSRNMETELRIAQALLGEVEIIDQGLIFRYENQAAGVAQFYSAGDFEVVFSHAFVPIQTVGAMAVAERMLSDMGIETAGLVLDVTYGGQVITATGAYRGAAIFNNTIEFIFDDYYLRVIRGRYVSGFEPIENGRQISTIGTVLLGFMANVRSGEIYSTNILKIEPGFQFRPSGAIGEGIISPAWFITTETGSYMADCETGEFRRIEG